jgi:hypothetical protein
MPSSNALRTSHYGISQITCALVFRIWVHERRDGIENSFGNSSFPRGFEAVNNNVSAGSCSYLNKTVHINVYFEKSQEGGGLFLTERSVARERIWGSRHGKREQIEEIINSFGSENRGAIL